MDGTCAWNAGDTRRQGPVVSTTSVLGMNDVVMVESDAPPDAPPARKETSRGWLVVKVSLSAAVIVACFFYAIPKFASYSEVWTEIKTMAPLEIGILLVATALNLLTYWWQNMVSIPRLGLWQAAVNNQTATTVANTMPRWLRRRCGQLRDVSIVGIHGVGRRRLRGGDVRPQHLREAPPPDGRARPHHPDRTGERALVGASVVGVLLLAGLVMLFALVMWKKQFAYGIGSGLGYVAMRVARLGRRPMAFAWGDVAVRFRRNSIDLMVARWLALSSSTIISHLTLYLVLLLALRFVGVSNDEVSWAGARGVRVRAPAHGVADHTGRCGRGGGRVHRRDHPRWPGPHHRAGRGLPGASGGRRPGLPALTYGIQIPIGAITFVIWKLNKRWRKPSPVPVPVAVAVPTP